MNRWPWTPLKEHVMEVSVRKGEKHAEILSVTNAEGFVRSLDTFDKQVFSQDTSNYKIVQFNDLAYNPSRINVGSVALCQYPHGGAVSPMYVVVRTRATLLPQYLLYFLRSEIGRQHIIHHSVGAVRFQLRFIDLEQLQIPLPPLQEQEQIVQTLEDIEELRKLGSLADKRSQALVPAIFDEIIGDPARNLKQWPIVPVSSFVQKFQSGRSVAPANDDALKSNNRILKISAVTWGSFDPEESKPVPDSYVPRTEQFVHLGDLLFSRANTTELVGATAIVEETPPNLLLPDKLWRFVWVNPDEIEPKFVLSLFQHPAIRRELGRRATGTGGSMKNISMDKVMSMEVPLPPVKFQRMFTTHIAGIRSLQSVQVAARKKLSELFESVTSSAFQGEL